MPQWASPVPVAKAGYYDRNARPTIHGHSTSAGPHVNTLRVSYTAPYPYAAFIEIAFLYEIRTTVAPTISFVEHRLTYTSYFGVTKNIMYRFVTTNVGLFLDTQTLTNFGILLPGDNFSIYTADASDGGTVTYNATIKGTEFEY